MPTQDKKTPQKPSRLPVLIDKDGRVFGKFDLFIPLFLIIFITLGIFIARVLLQKDEYVVAELFASGGEWFWNNPEPPYWLTDPVHPGAKEYDPQGNVLAEVLSTQKFQVGERKMLWMKVKLKVSKMNRSKQFQFRREPLQIGSLIFVAPNNIKIFCNVMWIEGINEEERHPSEKIITLKEYDMFPWTTDQLKVGDVMKNDEGNIMAEVIDKKVDLAEMTTTDNQGKAHAERNPLRRDMTVKVKMKTVKSKDLEYFSYFQPLKVGFYLWIPFEKENFSGNIIAVE